MIAPIREKITKSTNRRASDKTSVILLEIIGNIPNDEFKTPQIFILLILTKRLECVVNNLDRNKKFSKYGKVKIMGINAPVTSKSVFFPMLFSRRSFFKVSGGYYGNSYFS